MKKHLHKAIGLSLVIAAILAAPLFTAHGAAKPAARITAQLNVLVAVEQDYIGVRAFFTYNIVNAPVKQLTLSVPAGYDVIAVSGAGIKSWDVKNNVVTVLLEQEVKGAYALELSLEAPRDASASELNLPELATVGAAFEKGHLAVTGFPLLELGLVSAANAARIDPTELPDGLRNAAGKTIMYAFRFSRHPYTIALSASSYENAPALDATIDMANLVCLITDSGKSVIRVIYEVRNNAAQFLRVTLPEGSKVWGSFVGDQAVRSARDKDGRVLIPIITGASGPGSSFKVEIIYYAPLTAMKKNGKISAVFPRTDVPASEMLATLYLPQDFNYKDFEGSLKELKTDIARILPALPAAGPVAPGKDKISLRGQGYLQNSSENRQRQMVMEQDLKSSMGAYLGRMDTEPMTAPAATPGILPVKFNVPLRGSVHRFSQLIVIDEAPAIAFSFKEAGKPLPWTAIMMGVRIVIIAMLLVLIFQLIRWARAHARNERIKADMGA
ncbi:MAG TPA: hypothetical protein VM658_01845 [bacterium]|nr:hypothetical protein [bacterium]